MELVIYCIALIFLYYGIQIALLVYGFSKVTPFVYSKNKLNNAVKFSIVIPFKNEADNLPDLLDSITKLDYDKLFFEVILVNDASTDKSLKIISDWRFLNPYVHLTVLDNVIISQSSKKDAITRAITIAKHPWIFTTDADCVLPTNILNCYSAFIQVNPDKQFLIGGVNIANTANFLSNYQTLDFCSLQAVTIGSFGINEAFMCNGANLVYSKNIFNSVQGFKNVNHIASGDDVFLLQKVIAHNKQLIAYVLNIDALVVTKPVTSWKKLIIQRARWGKKSTAYTSDYPKVLGIFTILANFGVLVLVIHLFFTTNFLIILTPLTFKLCVDFILLLKYNSFNKQAPLVLFPVSFLIYPVVTALVFLQMVMSNSNWKK